MTQQDLIDLVDRLRAETAESEWLEFKKNRYEPQELGEYLSALSNAAAWKRRPMGYLVFGINDDTHDVAGTAFDPYSSKAKGNQDLLIWVNAHLNPNPGFDVDVVEHPDGRVVLLSVRAAQDQSVYFFDKAFVRVGSSKVELRHVPEAQRAIFLGSRDWSAEICEQATTDSLDPAAIAEARRQFKVKHQSQGTEVDSWSDKVFLNKAKLTINTKVTNTALLLLGRDEVSTLLSPAVAKLSWILKDSKNLERDYEHFGPPFLLQVDRVIAKIRTFLPI